MSLLRQAQEVLKTCFNPDSIPRDPSECLKKELKQTLPATTIIIENSKRECFKFRLVRYPEQTGKLLK